MTASDSTTPPTGAHQIGDRVALHGEVASVVTARERRVLDVKFDVGFRLALDPAHLVAVQATGDVEHPDVEEVERGAAQSWAAEDAEKRILALLDGLAPHVTPARAAELIRAGQHLV